MLVNRSFSIMSILGWFDERSMIGIEFKSIMECH